MSPPLCECPIVLGTHIGPVSLRTVPVPRGAVPVPLGVSSPPMTICTHCRRDGTLQCPGLALSPSPQRPRPCHPGVLCPQGPRSICIHPSRGVPSSWSQGHHPCPPWGVPAIVSPALLQSQGCPIPIVPGIWSLTPEGCPCSHGGGPISHPKCQPSPPPVTTGPMGGTGSYWGGATHGGGALRMWVWSRAELRPVARCSSPR